jgi:hypothetical protein
MDYFRRFRFLFAAPAFDADDLEGLRSLGPGSTTPPPTSVTGR